MSSTKNLTAAEHKAKLEKELSLVAGRPVEITVRGDRAFTFAFNGICELAVVRIKRFLRVPVEVEQDDEIGTFIYADVA